MRKLLKLHHHKHTGKVLHHRHTSYRALALVVVLAGACMLLTNRLAAAASYDVTAQILAPIPAEPPGITSPANGSVYGTPNVTIAGSCPSITPPVIIVIYEGPTALGSQQCSALGSFAVPVSLHTGAQTLVATVTTITNGVGGSSQPIVVTYLPGAAPPARATAPQPAGTTRSTPRGAGEQELEIHSQSPFIVYGPSKPAVWNGSFAGGQPPYTVNIAWGDGDVTWLRNVGSNPVRAQHQYDTVKPSYRITITLRDSANHELQMRISAVSPATPSAGSLTLPGSTTTLFSRWLYFVYLLMLLFLLALWAIEHRNAQQLALATVTRRKSARSSAASKRTARR